MRLKYPHIGKKEKEKEKTLLRLSLSHPYLCLWAGTRRCGMSTDCDVDKMTQHPPLL